MSLTRIRHKISSRHTFFLGAVGLTLILGAYIALSEFRHKANPLDQMTPTIGMVWEAFKVSVTPDEFTGEVALTADIAASLSLLLYGFSLAVSVSLFLGLHAGALPWVNALLDPVLKLFAYIPTIALLFLIFVLFGYGQGAKIFLIFLQPWCRSLVRLHYTYKAFPKNRFGKPRHWGPPISRLFG